MSEADDSLPNEAAGLASPRESSTLFERLRGLFGIAAPSVRDDIEEAIDESAGADFTAQERAILKNVLALHDVRVAEIMAPRADVIAVHVEASLREVLSLFRTAGHSRLPVYGETLDDPRGMIHIRDFLDFLAGDPRFGLGGEAGGEARSDPAALDTPLSAANILRPVLYAPPSMPALDLLLRMQTSRTHMALVIDEYGGTDGLVSIEDVVESIVGDIEDEHDEAETPTIHPAGEGVYVVEARAALDEVSTALGFDFVDLPDAQELDTIGGLLTATAGRVPSRGEILKGPGPFEFEVLDADPRRLKRLRIRSVTAREGSGAKPVVPDPRAAP